MSDRSNINSSDRITYPPLKNSIHWT